MKWKIINENDTGPGDDFYCEWWIVTNGLIKFRADNENDAIRLCALLNKYNKYF